MKKGDLSKIVCYDYPFYSKYSFIIEKEIETEIIIKNQYCQIRFNMSIRDFDVFCYLKRVNGNMWIHLSHLFEKIDENYDALIESGIASYSIEDLFRKKIENYCMLIELLLADVLIGDMKLIIELEEYFDYSKRASEIIFRKLPESTGFIIPKISEHNWRQLFNNFFEQQIIE